MEAASGAAPVSGFRERGRYLRARGQSWKDNTPESYSGRLNEIAATSPRPMQHLRSQRHLRSHRPFGQDVSSAGLFRILHTANTRAADPSLYEAGASPAGELQRPTQRHRCNDISAVHATPAKPATATLPPSNRPGHKCRRAHHCTAATSPTCCTCCSNGGCERVEEKHHRKLHNHVRAHGLA